MLLITSCQGNLDKLRLGWPLGLSMDLTLLSIFFFFNLTYYINATLLIGIKNYSSFSLAFY